MDTHGDAFFAAFAHAEPALLAAAEGQLALRGPSLAGGRHGAGAHGHPQRHPAAGGGPLLRPGCEPRRPHLRGRSRRAGAPVRRRHDELPGRELEGIACCAAAMLASVVLLDLAGPVQGALVVPHHHVLGVPGTGLVQFRNVEPGTRSPRAAVVDLAADATGAAVASAAAGLELHQPGVPDREGAIGVVGWVGARVDDVASGSTCLSKTRSGTKPTGSAGPGESRRLARGTRRAGWLPSRRAHGVVAGVVDVDAAGPVAVVVMAAVHAGARGGTGCAGLGRDAAVGEERPLRLVAVPAGGGLGGQVHPVGQPLDGHAPEPR